MHGFLFYILKENGGADYESEGSPGHSVNSIMVPVAMALV